MGCKECKKKQGQKNESTTIPLMPESIVKGDYNGNFLFKVVTFLGVILLLPFIFIILIGQMFLTFFLPKSKGDFTNKFVNIFTIIIEKYGKYKAKKIIKRRNKDFNNNINYDNYEVYETEEYTTEDILEDSETLEWENLSNPKGEEGNNKKGE